MQEITAKIMCDERVTILPQPPVAPSPSALQSAVVYEMPTDPRLRKRATESAAAEALRTQALTVHERQLREWRERAGLDKPSTPSSPPKVPQAGFGLLSPQMLSSARCVAVAVKQQQTTPPPSETSSTSSCSEGELKKRKHKSRKKKHAKKRKFKSRSSDSERCGCYVERLRTSVLVHRHIVPTRLASVVINHHSGRVR
jgi:hypothetical protein